MKRREFIKSGLAIGSLAYCTPIFNIINPGIKLNPEERQNKIVVTRGDLKKSIEAIFENLGGSENLIKKGSNILIKPNVSFPVPPEWGATTDPKVIKELTEFLYKAGAERVAITDFPMSRAQMCYARTGIKDLLTETPKLKLIELEKEKQFTEIDIPDGKALKKVKIANILNKFDLIINLPHAKSHSATQVSFGLKNLMGLIWDRSYLHEKTNIHQSIADLAIVIKPHITIIEATNCLLTNGPQGPGKIESFDMLIGSFNIVSADAYACTIANWNNQSISAFQIPHIKAAYEMNLGEIDISKMTVKEISF